MAVYQKHFSYNNRSNTEFGLHVITFSPDEGENDSFLSVESIYTDNFNGTMRHDYGAKYNNPAMLYITMVKNNYTDFSRSELREVVDWLTGLRKVSWLDLYNDDTDEITFSFLGRITDIKLQKMDARIIGIKAEFTSVSPWAYSDIKKYNIGINGSRALYPICNCSDEDGIYIYPKVVFTNRVSNGSLKIFNTVTREETILKNLAMNEIVTMDSNQIIYSDNTAKIFGDDFNFQWLRLAPGYNHINISGTGTLSIEFRDIFKVGEAFDDNDLMNIKPADRNVLLLTTIQLFANNWRNETATENGIPTYSHDLTVDNTTEYSKIDLQPSEEQLLSLQFANIELQIINDDGNIKAYAYGGKPSTDYTFQATIEETDIGVIHRRASTTLYADAWYNQGDIYYQPVYVKDVTRYTIIDLELTETQIALLEDNHATLLIKNEQGTTTAYAIGYKPVNDYYINLILTETTQNAAQIRASLSENGVYAEPLYF